MRVSPQRSWLLEGVVVGILLWMAPTLRAWFGDVVAGSASLTRVQGGAANLLDVAADALRSVGMEPWMGIVLTAALLLLGLLAGAEAGIRWGAVLRVAVPLILVGVLVLGLAAAEVATGRHRGPSYLPRRQSSGFEVPVLVAVGVSFAIRQARQRGEASSPSAVRNGCRDGW